MKTRPAPTRRATPRRLAAAPLAVSLLLVSALAGWAYWTAGSTPGGNGAAAATSVARGPTPTASAIGQAVTVSWTAGTLASGQPVDGYLIKRYDAGTLAPQTILSACAGTISATSCVESGVPAGSWVYSVTPRLATNWLGAESATSGAVTVTPPPTVTINQSAAQADPTSASPISFTVVFSQVVTGFATGDVTLAGTAGAATGTVTGSGTTYNVAVTGMTGQGTVIATVPAGAATSAGGPSTASTSTDNTVTRDTVAPTVTINQAAGQPDPTSASPINFTVVFSETVTGFTTGDMMLTGTTGGTKVGTVTGSGTTYNVAVSGMTGDGTVLPSIAAAVAQDLAGNTNTASASTDNTVTYDDTTAPTVTINQAAGQADPTNASPINFTVMFSETVTGFATGDVTVSGTSGGTKVGTVTGSGTTYNVAVTGMTGQGTVVAMIAAGTATDGGANVNTASTSSDNTVTRDAVAPTVTINQTAGQLDPTNASPISFTVVFSKSVTGFATGDVTLTGTAGATTGTVTGSGTTYTVAVTAMTGQGTVIATVPGGTATDAAGNTNTASTSTDNTVTRDTVPPSVTMNQAASQTDPTGVTPVNFTVVFSQATTTFTTGDVTLAGTAAATTATVTGSGTTYTVAVTGMSANGTVIATVAAGAATDEAGNPNTASTSTDNTVTFSDITAPTVTINQAGGQADPTNASPVNFTVVFSETVTGFATGDVTLTGTAGASTGTVTGSGTTYNVAVTGMTSQGTVVPVITAGRATDAVGNPNAASTSTDNTVIWDTVAPSAAINQAGAQADPTNAATINFTVVFSETVTGFATGDVTFTGTTGGTKVGTVTGTGTTYTVAVTGMTGQGTVIATVAAGVASDLALNASAASTSTDNTVTRDTVAPTVTINQAAGQVDPTPASPINYTVVLSETTTSFATGDVTFTGTSTGIKVGTVTGSGTTYNVAVTGMTSNGTVTAAIAAGAATDPAGNANTASTSTDNTVTYTGIGCTPGSATVTAAEDAWTNESSPTQNRGADSTLLVQSKSTADNRVLVKFALPTVPAGCAVTSATLDLYNNSPANGRTIDVYRAASTWAEGTVTWANQPATTGTAVGVTTSATAGLQVWSITAQVQAQYAGANNGFILRDRTEDDASGPRQGYVSREAGSTPPQLVVIWG